MNISIYIKSGTGGYYDECGSDFCVKDFEDVNFPIPRIGETIEILENNDSNRTSPAGDIFQEYHQYLVVDVCYWMANAKYGVSIYVVPIGRQV